MLCPGYREGTYYSSYPNIAPLSLALAANRLYLMPFWCNGHDWTRIGVNVTVAAVGKSLRLGIYENAAGTPSDLLLDAGTVDAGTVAEKEIIIAHTLSAGWYWLVVVSDGGPTVTAFNGGSSGSLVRVSLGSESAAGGEVLFFHGTDGSAVESGLPASPPSLSAQTGATNIPKVWLRKV